MSTLHKFGCSHYTHTFKPAAHSRPKAYPEIRSEHLQLWRWSGGTLIAVIFMVFCLSSLFSRPSWTGRCSVTTRSVSTLLTLSSSPSPLGPEARLRCLHWRAEEEGRPGEEEFYWPAEELCWPPDEEGWRHHPGTSSPCISSVREAHAVP